MKIILWKRKREYIINNTSLLIRGIDLSGRYMHLELKTDRKLVDWLLNLNLKRNCDQMDSEFEFKGFKTNTFFS